MEVYRWFIKVYVSESQAHSGNKSLYVPVGQINGVLAFEHDSVIGTNEDIFMSWWVRRVHDGIGQWKMFRVCYDYKYEDQYTPQFKMFNWDTAGEQFFVNPGPTAGDNVGGGYGYPYPSEDNRWYRMDIQVHTASSHGASDGTYTVSLHDPTGGSLVTSKTAESVMSFNSDNDFYKWFIWQNYVGNGITSQETWMDDLYIQVGTQARVEICDSSDWALREHCEIQSPSAWSETSVEITLNQGSFSVNDGVYIYVIDADGNVNTNGYLATITDSIHDVTYSSGLNGSVVGDYHKQLQMVMMPLLFLH